MRQKPLELSTLTKSASQGGLFLDFSEIVI